MKFLALIFEKISATPHQSSYDLITFGPSFMEPTLCGPLHLRDIIEQVKVYKFMLQAKTTMGRTS